MGNPGENLPNIMERTVVSIPPQLNPPPQELSTGPSLSWSEHPPGRLPCRPCLVVGQQSPMMTKVRCCLVYGRDTVPCSPRASQNVVADVTLLDKLPKAETLSEWKTHREIQDLLGLALQQQAESSMSQCREPETNHYTASMPTANDATS